MPMFEALSERLQGVFQKLGRRGRLTEKDVDQALREVRLALLEADVHYRVVKAFLARVRERAVGEEVLKSLTPAQQVVKIVHEELVRLLGEANVPLERSATPPSIYMLVGLQGSGKTTTAAKLALHLRRQGQRPLLVAADVYRPAAIQQLEILGRQLQIPVHSEGTEASPPEIARHALERARREGFDPLILDTAGRLHIDEAMMEELVAIREALDPTEVLLVVDAMTGQDAVQVARTFHERVGLTGLILTKVDGDARGGAALSIREVTGVPIKFLGTGEKTDALEPFHPDRLAGRILGMGDVLSLIEKAEAAIEEEKARKLEKKLRKGEFDLEDFLEQLRALQRMGPLQQILEMLPGMGGALKGMDLSMGERQLKRIEAIILSMTPEERRNPEILNASRKRRIARGSGTTVQEVNQLLRQYKMMRRMLKQLTRGRGVDILSMFR